MSKKPVLSALSGEHQSPSPVWLMRQAGRYLPEYRAVRAKAGSFLDLCYAPALAEDVTLQPIKRFGFDAAILFSDILVIPHALGQNLSFKENEGPALTPIGSARDLDRLDPSAMMGRLEPVIETVSRLTKSIPPECALIGFAGAPWTIATYMIEGGGSRDFAKVKRVMWDQPDLFGRLINLLVDATIAYLAAQARAGAEVLQLFDSWAGVLPEDEFRSWVIEPAGKIVAGLKRQVPNVKIIGFPRNAGVLYKAYADETGVDGVSLDWTVPLGWARAQLQPKVTVQGNLDPQLLLADRAALDRGIDRILKVLGDGPFIFNLGHGILPETPIDAVTHLVDRIRTRRT